MELILVSVNAQPFCLFLGLFPKLCLQFWLQCWRSMATLLAVLVRILGNRVLRHAAKLPSGKRGPDHDIKRSNNSGGGSSPFSWYSDVVTDCLFSNLSPLLTESSSMRTSWGFLGTTLLWIDSIATGGRHRQSPSVEHGDAGW